MPFQQRRTQIGKRRHWLEFRKKQSSDDGMGGQVVSYPRVGNAYGLVTALDERSREGVAALQLQGRAAYHVNINYRQDIADDPVPTDWRVVYGRKVLELHQAVDDTGRRKRLILLTSETQ